jgi:hypothetical protein
MRSKPVPKPAPQPAPKFPKLRLPAVAPRWLFAVMLLLGVVRVFIPFGGNIVDTDFWWHLKTGQFIVQHHSLPVPDPFSWTTYMGRAAYAGEEIVRYFNLTHEWLAQVLFYVVYTIGGFAGLILLRQLLLLSLCGVVGLVIYRRNHGFYRALFSSFATAQVAIFTARDRPYLITFLLVGVTIWILEDRRWLWLLPPMQLVWANCHSGFFLGWVVMGAYCAEALYNRWRGKPAADERRLFLASGAAALVSFLNPNGYRVFHILLLYKRSALQSGIMEWQRPKYWEPSAFTEVLYLSFAVFLFALLFARKKVRVSDTILFALFAYASLTAARNIILIGIIGPILIGSYIPWKWRVPVWLHIILLVALALGVRSEVMSFKLHYRASDEGMPSGAADFILAHHLKGRLLNTYETGGYLIWRLYPEQQVFQDGRALNETVYGDGRRILFNAEADASGTPSGADLQRKYGIDIMMVPGFDSLGSAYYLAVALADPSQKEWKLVYQDNKGVIFMRSPPPGMPVLNSLDALVSMESQCNFIMDHGGFAGCASTLANVFSTIGDTQRAAKWARLYREHPGLMTSPVETR